MKCLTILVCISIVFQLSLFGTDGCMRKVSNVIMNTTTTASPPTEPPEETPPPPAELSELESLYLVNSNLHGSEFYIEIEESTDNSVKVHHFTSLPPIYSQIINNETHSLSEPQEQNITDTEENTIRYNETGPPPIESLTAEEDSEPALSLDDEIVRRDWKGNCLFHNWDYCNKMKSIKVMNVFNYTKDKDILWQHLDLDCLNGKDEDVLCLHNGWTANRCHLLCMSKCNRAILQGWNEVVSYKWQCKYIRRK